MEFIAHTFHSPNGRREMRSESPFFDTADEAIDWLCGEHDSMTGTHADTAEDRRKLRAYFGMLHPPTGGREFVNRDGDTVMYTVSPVPDRRLYSPPS